MRSLDFLAKILLLVMIAPPLPEVIILFALKERHEMSPIVPVNLFLNFPEIYLVPKLSDASSIIFIFLFLQRV